MNFKATSNVSNKSKHRWVEETLRCDEKNYFRLNVTFITRNQLTNCHHRDHCWSFHPCRRGRHYLLHEFVLLGDAHPFGVSPSGLKQWILWSSDPSRAMVSPRPTMTSRSSHLVSASKPQLSIRDTPPSRMRVCYWSWYTSSHYVPSSPRSTAWSLL